MIRYCDNKVVNENGEQVPEYKCPGHLAKFDDCVQEALYELMMENMGEQTTGNDEYEGTYTTFNVTSDEITQINPDSSEERWVVIPEGYYILQTSSGGFVYTLKYHSYSQMKEAYDVADDRYQRWDMGCEPTGHDECRAFDECQLGGVPSY